MNKYFFIIILLITAVIFSCSTETKLKYYPSENVFSNEQKLSFVEIENLSFKEIFSLIDKKTYNDSLPYIVINYLNTEYNILVQNSHPHAMRRNILSVGLDSVFIDKGYNIRSLGKLMNRHYSNNGKSYEYPLSYKTAFIELNLKPKSLQTKKAIIQIVNVFDSLNKKFKDSLQLKILFKREIPPPPPPPPAKNN